MGVLLAVLLTIVLLAAVAVVLSMFPSALPIFGVEISLLAVLITLLVPLIKKRRTTNAPYVPATQEPVPGHLSTSNATPPLVLGRSSPRPVSKRRQSVDMVDFLKVLGVATGIVLFIAYVIVGASIAHAADNPVRLGKLTVVGTRPIMTNHKGWSDVYRKYDSTYHLSGNQVVDSVFDVPPSHLTRFVGGSVELSDGTASCQKKAMLRYAVSSDQRKISERTLLPGNSQGFGYRFANHTAHLEIVAKLTAPQSCHLRLIFHDLTLHTLPMWFGWIYQYQLESS